MTFNGRTMSFAAWARSSGIPRTTLRNRLASGWSLEKALTTPSHAAGTVPSGPCRCRSCLARKRMSRARRAAFDLADRRAEAAECFLGPEAA